MDEKSGCFAPDLYGILIPGRRGRLLATLFTAAGQGPHPAVLLLHGIPGNEKNQDLAHALRRAGCHVMTFHYSGSWGSDGAYSLAHDLEDTETVLDYMLNDTCFGIDKSRVYLAGHSLGGFVCANVAARRPEVKAAALLFPCDIALLPTLMQQDPGQADVITGVLQESAAWLNGTSGEALAQEAAAHAAEWRFAALAPQLAQKPVLLVDGTRDIYTPGASHTRPLAAALRALGGSPAELHFATDHFASDHRLQLADALVQFLERLR